MPRSPCPAAAAAAASLAPPPLCRAARSNKLRFSSSLPAGAAAGAAAAACCWLARCCCSCWMFSGIPFRVHVSETGNQVMVPYSTHSQKIFNSSVGVVESGTHSCLDLGSFEAHSFHVGDSLGALGTHGQARNTAGRRLDGAVRSRCCWRRGLAGSLRGGRGHSRRAGNSLRRSSWWCCSSGCGSGGGSGLFWQILDCE